MMNFRNTIFGTMLTLALVCGAVAAFPTASSAIAYSNVTSQKMREQIYVKTQNMDYTDENGETIRVAVSSNDDDSRMLVYSNLYGDNRHAVIHRNEEGDYEVKDCTFSEEDAKKIAQIASENEQWREM